MLGFGVTLSSSKFRATWHPPDELAPRMSDLVRVGRNADGGYLVPRNVLGEVRGCLSFGLGAEWSFEQSLVRLKMSLIDPRNIIFFDASISLLGLVKYIVYMGRRTFYEIRTGRRKSEKKFKLEDLRRALIALARYLFDFRFSKTRFVHIRKFVVSKSLKKNEISFQQALGYRLDPTRTIVKIDIEGGEWDLLKREEDVALLKDAPVLIIEFHIITNPEFIRIVSMLNNFFWIAHLHGNTTQKSTDTGVPLNLEITFVNKKFDTSEGFRSELPIHGLDFPQRHGELQTQMLFVA